MYVSFDIWQVDFTENLFSVCSVVGGRLTLLMQASCSVYTVQ